MEEFLYRARPWAVTFIAHNWPVLVYALTIPWAALHAFLRPSRRTLLFLYSLLLLTFAFEFEKHGVRIMLDTTNYLFSVETNPAPRFLSQWLLAEVAPTAAHLLGLTALVISIAPLPCWRPAP